MSADEDISNELLALAGDGEADQPRKKRRQAGADRNGRAKRRRPNDTTDDDLESEEDAVDLYPLEGKYKDEKDRETLLDLNELEREGILAQRLEEQQRHLDSIKLERMHKIAMGQATSDDEEAVSKAAKRKHIAPGTSKTKAKKLDELKAKRAAHAARAKREESRRALSDSGSGSDMEESDEEEEGQVTRWDEEEQKRQGRDSKDEKEKKLEKEDLEKVRLGRDLIEKWCCMPKFEDLVKDCWIRFLVGPGDKGQNVYRVCQIVGLTAESPVTYKIQDTVFNQQALLKHGKSTKPFNMDRISNSPFTDREFDRLVAQCKTDNVELPSRADIEAKAIKLEEYRHKVPTDQEITQMIKRKAGMSGKKDAHQAKAEKSRLHQERALALARHNLAEVQRLDTLTLAQERASPAPTVMEDTFAKVNERNRKANIERIRKAEAAEAEERRRQGGLRPPVVRKLHSTGNTPVLGPQDTSKDAIQPLALDGGGLLTPRAITPAGSPSPSPKKAVPRLESKLATSIDLDLGDF
ncbi:plus-3-domain-containing protein [Dacryopinax primogenitus]|uniref:Plus-3-domain-containing protein n=1 Tax=Dacryopinax primogenitus (strain DJM 731) TaxID=1858805 RepID=M5GCL1_DACPD|nr:plus-3-domain-containing protein [Dacryopinax primogenitus]EJU03942.1 plus-3-domain-containing protein [Dacryopinax primogenitus]